MSNLAWLGVHHSWKFFAHNTVEVHNRSIHCNLTTTQDKARYYPDVYLGDLEMPRVASFIATHEQGPRMPNGQRKEVVRLTLNNLQETYGSRLGRWRYPCALFIAEQDDDFVGCVGLSFQNFNPAHKEFTPVVLPNVSHNAYMQQQTRDSSTDEADDDNISMVLTHLLGHQNKGEMDIVPRLVKHCEELVKEWNYKYAHILAYLDNNAVDNVYKSLGYKKYFRGKTTRFVSSPVGLKQEACGYYCYRRAVDEEQDPQTTSQRILDYITGLLI